jgi:phospholipase C
MADRKPPSPVLSSLGKPAGELIEAEHGITRRRFVGAAAASLGALALGGAEPLLARHSGDGLPAPNKSGIEHIVLVMMENRSFDHLLGWMPNADGHQAGLSYSDTNGNTFSTHPLAPDYQGCGHPDPDHSYTGGRIEYDNGACDGWLNDPNNDPYCIGYYTQPDLSFLGRAAPEWTSFSRYFAAIMAETYPNRIYQHAAQTDRLTNTQTISTLPTIWDLLAARGISRRYYYSDVPMLALWGTKYAPISSSIAQFYLDCAAGTLPAVSFVDPRFLGESQGTSGDDHPHSDIRNGEAFLNRVYAAVTHSPAWHKTVLVMNYDEWGGFFEHVPPPAAAIPPATAAAGDTDGRLGFRVPCLLISPWSQRGFVSGTQFDHTSVLKLIEWRWGLPSLTIRDSTANNLAAALDFSERNFVAPQWVVPQGPFGTACPVTAPATLSSPTSNRDSIEEWKALADIARGQGWPIY